MPTVTYKKVVSDASLKNLLERIANHLDKDIIVHSGDRGHVPTGGSKTSLHLQHRAADFHIQKMTDSDGFKLLKQDYKTLFDADEEWEVIHHGKFTETEAEHLHIGRYGNGRKGKVKFKTEGLSAATRGRYNVEVQSLT